MNSILFPHSSLFGPLSLSPSSSFFSGSTGNLSFSSLMFYNTCYTYVCMHTSLPTVLSERVVRLLSVVQLKWQGSIILCDPTRVSLLANFLHWGSYPAMSCTSTFNGLRFFVKYSFQTPNIPQKVFTFLNERSHNTVLLASTQAAI